MKTFHLAIIIIAFSMMILSISLAEGRISPMTVLQLYKDSDMILVGNVTSAEMDSSGIYTFYHVKVEQYLKSSQKNDTITVVGSGPNGGHPPPDPKFSVGDRVRLYLEKEDGMFMISMYSTKANPKCYGHELLGLGPFEAIPRGESGIDYSERNCGPPFATLDKNSDSFLPPRIQFKSGISALDVECNDDLVHIIKAKDLSPACVRQSSVEKLENQGWSNPGEIPSRKEHHIVTPPIFPTDISPCTIPYEQKPSTTSPVYPNGTIITTGYIPVLYMPTNSTGMICVKYENSNDPKPASMQIFDANNLSQKSDTTSYASPDTIAKGNSTVVYTISTGKQAGYYGVSFSCVPIPFAVGYDNQSKIVLDDFPWMNSKTMYCPLISYSSKIYGLDGIGIYYIKTISHDQLIYNIQNTTVISVHAGPTSQNVTFSLHIHTFDKPVHFWFDYKDSTITEFMTNPGFKQASNPCNWDITYNNAIQNAPWLRLDGINVKEKPVTIPPYSNGTFTFSVLAKNLSDGYYGLNPVVYGATSDTPAENAGTNYVAFNYPITIGTGIAWSLDSVGTCLR